MNLHPNQLSSFKPIAGNMNGNGDTVLNPEVLPHGASSSQVQEANSGLVPMTQPVPMPGLGSLDPTQIFNSAANWLGQIQAYVTENPLIAIGIALGLIVMVSGGFSGLFGSNQSSTGRSSGRRVRQD